MIRAIFVPKGYDWVGLWVGGCYIWGMDNRMIRRRKALYSQQEVAGLMGVSVGTVSRLEESFLSPEQRAYLNVVGYEIGFYPRRKRSRAGGGSGSPAS